LKYWHITTTELTQTKNLELVEEPLWLYLIGWFIENVVGIGCTFLSKFNLPTFLYVKDEDGTHYSLYDYYGTWGDLYCCFITTPMLKWYYKSHPSRKECTIGNFTGIFTC
jgi:hypothetical protein